MAGRKCKVCAHEARAEIEQAILAGEPRNAVADHYGLSRSSVARHYKKHLVPDLAAGERRVQAVAAGTIVRTPDREVANMVAQAVNDVSVAAAHRGVLTRLEKIVAACERELQDPNAPDQYFFGPRAREIRVAYTYLDEDGLEHRGASILQDLVDQALSGTGLQPVLIESKAADPRELLLKALKQAITGIISAAKISESAAAAAKVDLAGSDEWRLVMSALMEELAGVPNVRARVAKRLKAIAAGHMRKSSMGT